MPQMKFKLWLPVLLAAVLAACSQSHQTVEAPAATNSAVPSQSAQAAEKLGTGWGDEVESPVHSVDLRRVSQEPLAQSVLNYSSKDYHGRSVNSISLATVTPSLVMCGPPNARSTTTLRPLGPKVTRTAFARVFTPLTIFWRTSLPNCTSFAAMF